MKTVTWNKFNEVASKYLTTPALFKINKTHIDFKLGDEMTKPVVKLMLHHSLKVARPKDLTTIDLILNELFID